MQINEAMQKALIEVVSRRFRIVSPAGAGSSVMCGSLVCFCRGQPAVSLMEAECSFRVGKDAVKALAPSAGVPAPVGTHWISVPVATLMEPLEGPALLLTLAKAAATFSKTLPALPLKPQATQLDRVPRRRKKLTRAKSSSDSSGAPKRKNKVAKAKPASA